MCSSAYGTSIQQSEKQSKETLLIFEKDYPGKLKEENISSILEIAKKKRESYAERC